MRVLVAPDSFKGSLSSIELCQTIRHGMNKVMDAEVIEVPISDGGEGFLESICSVHPFQVELVNVKDPLGRTIQGKMAFDLQKRTAFIEMAKSTGLTHVSEDERNPYQSFSYGVGNFILYGLDKGCRTFIIGLGGSATNDAGVGMLLELGVSFRDVHNKPVEIESLTDIQKIASLDLQKVDPRLFECEFILATDVNNPLCGEQGATFVFGPQKGIAKERLNEIDGILEHYGKVLEKEFRKEIVSREGVGAAGGITASFLALFKTQIRQGIDILIEYLQLDQLLPTVDFVITGEGKLDHQTLNGKVIKGICELANQHHIPVVAVCGNIELSRNEIRELGLSAAFSICKGPSSIEESMKDAKQLVLELVENIAELLRI
ncbi:glycerate kinase [Ureibacillus sp. FSL K6-0786]|uniref:glycerate kinase n=1 Tax=Ureibacillus sp. FSL K6-0786 TaxID=2954607 RepID=UPI0030D9561F